MRRQKQASNFLQTLLKCLKYVTRTPLKFLHYHEILLTLSWYFLKQYNEEFIKFSVTLQRGGEKMLLMKKSIYIIKLDLPVVLYEIYLPL